MNKQIRLIELFSGYGSQALALKYLGINFEHWKTCEWAIKSIQAYKDVHFKDDNTDYSKGLAKDYLIEYLVDKGISQNYNEPMTKEQIKRLGEEKLRTIYNNIVATHNLTNIQQVHGEDLEIVDTNKYDYIMTYSFPCQSLSLAGKQEGMTKGSGTRSGMLWEVERILDELKNNNKNLPQILLMENVPQVHGKKNIKDFNLWIQKLSSLGYSNFYKDLNSKDFGVPQNRNRCFMVSILGKKRYSFPDPIKLERRLKDMLEENVDEKYYLSSSMKVYISSTNEKWTGNNKGGIVNKEIASTLNTGEGHRRCDASNYICDGLKENFNLNYLGAYQYSKMGEDLITSKNKRIKNLANKIDTVKDGQFLDFYNQTTNENISGTITTRIDASSSSGVFNNYHIRKLTPKECFRLMGVKDEDFENIAINQSNSSLYHLAGDSIVVNVLMEIFKKLLEVNK